MDLDICYEFVSVAQRKGLAFKSPSDIEGDAFSLYTNPVGHIYATSDPFKLAELVLLCADMTKDNYNLHVSLLSLMAGEKEITAPPRGKRRYTTWDYYVRAHPGDRLVYLSDWVMTQIKMKAQSCYELELVERFQKLMSA